MAAKSLKGTKVYKLAFERQWKIFEVAKIFPKEERYSLTDQVRRSSRRACINLLEVWRKKDTRPVLWRRLRTAIWETQKHQTGPALRRLANTFINNRTIS